MRDSRSGEVHTLANADRSRSLGREPRGASAEKAKSGIIAESRHADPEPKRTKTTSATDKENTTDPMDEDNFRRGPATSHELEPVDDENVSKKARVARNVLHIRGEDNEKFDVNEEAWPNADLAIHSSYEGTLTDGLPADTKSRLVMNEKSSI